MMSRLLSGVRNVLLDSLDDTMETPRKSSTSTVATHLELYIYFHFGINRTFKISEDVKTPPGVRNVLF